MDQITIRHYDTREYIYPVSRNRINIKLELQGVSPCTITVLYWKRFQENLLKRQILENYNVNGTSPYYHTVLELAETAHYLRYCFEIRQSGKLQYYSPHGIETDFPTIFFEYMSTNELDVLSPPAWSFGKVGYHIFVDRFANGNKINDPSGTVNWNTAPTRLNHFGGDLQGIIQKLDYFKELDISVICLSPIFSAPSNHKYDTTDYFQIDPAFGTTDDLKRLVDLAHKQNIYLVLDGVFNHIGYYSDIFQDVIHEGKKSQYWNWFYIDGDSIDTETPNYECVGDYKWMPKLRYSSPELRKYILSVARYWIEVAGIDGWRLDVADEVDFTFLEELRREVKSLNKAVLLIGETWKDGKDLLRGDQMDTIMNYRFRDNILNYFGKPAITKIVFQRRMEEMLFNYPMALHHHLYNLISSHDTPRILTVLNQDTNKLKLAIVLLMTFPGMPIVFYGDEIGTEGENDPDCRKTMDWNQIESPIRDFYQRMIQLRNHSQALQNGSFHHIDLDDKIYGFIRKSVKESMMVLLNPSTEDFHTTVDVSQLFENVSGSGHVRKIQIQVLANSFSMIRISQTGDGPIIDFIVDYQ
jgi:cyclomaltodextrinase / maltogenic alpha-amylase / neopullulanase